ncbi:hypothetical protein [Chitinophaga arvensicola]|uniref:Uncharacterized protein n=1 Tax=Chitinophaga arvensicola TaxID=29529 RepID=A0A1I0QJL0_9BACT|nr:hypothetical protein [Chitinophaga arvensicola]SEW27331.1 hypothetical protein SAMN04488122_1519 [Chitinophaga arvensicola]
METIVSVGFSFPSDEDDYIHFNSKSSLSDGDIIIFNPYLSNCGYELDYRNNFKGKPFYNSHSSFLILDHLAHWQNEIITGLNSGKTIFIILTEKNEFYIHTGKNNTVDLCHNYQFLPSSNFSLISATGKAIYPYSEIVTNLFKHCKDLFKYEIYIKSQEHIKAPLFATKSKDKILGHTIKIGKGNLVLIPSIFFPDDFYDNDEDWTKEALIWGKRFKQILAEISKSLKSEKKKTPTPDWTFNETYYLTNVTSTKNAILKNEEKIFKIQKDIAILEKSLTEQEVIKDLLFESGEALEYAVRKSLKILGYSAEGYDDGKLELDQIILSPEGDRFIGECEGKDLSHVDISKFRQLQDSLHEDFAREEVDEKAFGILFGNPQRLIDPAKRTLDFTDKCRRGAEREKIALIKTADLFNITRYVQESGDENFKVECRKAIKEQLGRVVQFPPLPM